MNDKIIVSYGEMMLKGKNLKDFKKNLRNHILTLFKNIDAKLNIRHDKFIIENYLKKDENEIINILNHIPGLYSYSIAKSILNDDNLVATYSLELLSKIKNGESFKIETRRNDKQLPYTSQDYTKKIADLIFKLNPNLNADLKKPDHILNFVLEKNNEVLVFFKKIKLLGGYPSLSQNKVLHLISGGIDSPVAAIELIKKGINLSLIHFESSPLTPIESFDKVYELSKIIASYLPKNKIKLYVVPFKEIHEIILKKVSDPYIITVMRRLMYKISSLFATSINTNVLSSGDSIGQVASQTLESLTVIDNVTDKTILRPLAIFDKDEIIKKSIKYNTYDISIRPYSDCCTVYLPKKPSTKPSLDKTIYFEKLCDVDELIELLISKILCLTVKSNDNIKFSTYDIDLTNAIKKYNGID